MFVCMYVFVCLTFCFHQNVGVKFTDKRQNNPTEKNSVGENMFAPVLMPFSEIY